MEAARFIAFFSCVVQTTWGLTKSTANSSIVLATESAAGKSANGITPIYYLHVPKSGSSFATTVVHHTCGDEIADSVWVQEPSTFMAQWGSVCNHSRFGRFETGHDPLTITTAADLKHVVLMIRNPSQRIMSGYYHDLHDCWDLRRTHQCKESEATNGKFKCNGDKLDGEGRYIRDPEVIPPEEYGKCVENCTANMLTGSHCGTQGPVDVNRAVHIVGQLGFVGLTEQWALSICLWHRRFGGRMLPAELMNVRPGVAGSTSKTGATTYNSKELLGKWRSAADTRVYDAGVRRFWDEVWRYGVDRKACESETRWLLGDKTPKMASS
eukprot:TRINITY_DN377_c0_g1_i1.p1 TRINITY_DN377_c0_g1~~TRINITY_DN377_c0_g1_i1.p1  ORF type:complete len:349 (-),score=30.40 TRINITY_DN377_c0_g1_i1:66-1040(-)